MLRRIVSTIIILTGLLVVAYPKGSELFHNYKQQKLIKEWQQSLLAIESSYTTPQENNETILLGKEKAQNKDISNNRTLKDYSSYSERYEEAEKKKKENERKKKEAEEKRRKEYIKKNMEGMLIIEKINLSLPILHGATDKNLKMSAASIENTGEAGKIGNYSIAGHRSRTFGRNFNRLDEVEIGDILEVDDGKNQYRYTVSEKLYVKPEEVWVLNGNKKDKEITLVTCHPMTKSTHRLIIKGKINE
ncbi:class D sortase [Brassicibacter mesophilus]|uniref:class D sortase n=1 Tax=Brassicibacter mesophilus TaxID=745119 RepID=UPI003D2086C5